MEYKYDVTLSFAGEDREYVEKVAQILIDEKIKVFYDKFEEVDLWGKDLGVHFDYVYRKGAKYCVPFISKSYKDKIWTNHEIKTAISRSIETNVEYILPARFDDTEIDGIRPTLAFIDLRKVTPEKFAHLIMKKLEKEPTIPLPEQLQEDEEKFYLGVKIFASINSKKLEGVGLGINFTNKNTEHRYINEPYFEVSENVVNSGTNTFFLVDKTAPVSFPNKLEYGQSVSVTYKLKQASMDMWEGLPNDATVQSFLTTSLGEKFKSNKVDVKKIINLVKELK